MPVSTEELQHPGIYSLLPIREFLDDVMVRTDGCYVAGFRIGLFDAIYGVDDVARVEMARRMDGVLRVIPEQSMRVQFRYESEGGCESESDRPLAFVYFIWNPELHGRLEKAAPSKVDGRSFGFRQIIKSFREILVLPLSVAAQTRDGQEKHHAKLEQFSAYLHAIEQYLNSAGFSPERLGTAQFLVEVKRASSPDPLKEGNLKGATVREQLPSVSILEETESGININGYFYGCTSFKAAPTAIFFNRIPELLSAGIPVTLSTHVVIPDQQKVIKEYESRSKKLQTALTNTAENQGADGEGQTRRKKLTDLLNIQKQIISGTTRTARVSIAVVFRTPSPARTKKEYEAAQLQLALYRGQILEIIARESGAEAVTETLFKRQVLLAGLPGLATEDRRDLDLLVSAQYQEN
jgi:hypothetical protein